MMRSGIFLFSFILLCGFVTISQNKKNLLFIGTYTEGKADSGIYVCAFNSASGEIKKLSAGKGLINPSFIHLSPNGKYLYACTNSKLPEHGKVAAFGIDSVNGDIHYLNTQSSLGENPVYVNIHPNGKYIVNANYTEGNVSVYASQTNGTLSNSLQSIQFSDSSIIRSRQDKSHLHAIVFSPDGRYVIFPDLGADKIRVFEFDIQSEKPLIEKNDLNFKCIPGSGPRHFTFHPNGKFAYCIEELSGCVSAYTYNTGKLDSLQRILSYSKQLNTYAGADIHISPDGLFLYSSNRIENTIAIFQIDTNSGKLKLIGHQATLGEHPRNFTIDPSGIFLLVANLGSNNIVVFKRNTKTGLLTKTKYELKIPRPSCLQIRAYN